MGESQKHESVALFLPQLGLAWRAESLSCSLPYFHCMSTCDSRNQRFLVLHHGRQTHPAPGLSG